MINIERKRMLEILPKHFLVEVNSAQLLYQSS